MMAVTGFDDVFDGAESVVGVVVDRIEDDEYCELNDCVD